MKPFNLMTSAELRAYAGPVYIARCTVHHLRTGHEVPHDVEAPTARDRDRLVHQLAAHYGPILSRTDYSPAQP